MAPSMDGKMIAVCTNHAPEGAYTLVFGYVLIQREQHYSLQGIITEPEKVGVILE
jgi:hypothetical protein